MFGKTLAPTSTEAGIVKTSRNVVGEPPMVTVLTAGEGGGAEPELDCWASVNAWKDRNKTDDFKES